MMKFSTNLHDLLIQTRMGEKNTSTIFGQIYQSTSELWNKLVPVSVESFVEQVTDEEDTRADRVEIQVESKYEGDEPSYLIIYKAYKDDQVLLKAREKFSCEECKDAHLKAEGTIPEKVKKMVWSRTDQKAKQVYEAVTDAGIPVDIEIPSSRDTDIQEKE